MSFYGTLLGIRGKRLLPNGGKERKREKREREKDVQRIETKYEWDRRKRRKSI